MASMKKVSKKKSRRKKRKVAKKPAKRRAKKRGKKSAPQWTRHEVDNDSGVGTQFTVADLNKDGLLDIVTSNKKGVHVFLQQRRGKS